MRSSELNSYKKNTILCSRYIKYSYYKITEDILLKQTKGCVLYVSKQLM